MPNVAFNELRLFDSHTAESEGQVGWIFKWSARRHYSFFIRLSHRRRFFLLLMTSFRSTQKRNFCARLTRMKLLCFVAFYGVGGCSERASSVWEVYNMNSLWPRLVPQPRRREKSCWFFMARIVREWRHANQIDVDGLIIHPNWLASVLSLFVLRHKAMTEVIALRDSKGLSHNHTEHLRDLTWELTTQKQNIHSKHGY